MKIREAVKAGYVKKGKSIKEKISGLFNRMKVTKITKCKKYIVNISVSDRKNQAGMTETTDISATQEQKFKKLENIEQGLKLNKKSTPEYKHLNRESKSITNEMIASMRDTGKSKNVDADVSAKRPKGILKKPKSTVEHNTGKKVTFSQNLEEVRFIAPRNIKK